MRYSNQYSNAHLRKWEIVIDLYGQNCAYCHDQPATQIDHVVPRAWKESNRIQNLRPACSWCNLLAGSQVFETFDDKYNWLRKERAKKARFRNKRTVCTTCKLPFQNPAHSPNFFLCAECFDLEYDKSYRLKRAWKEWIDLCQQAGFIIDAHRALGNVIRSAPGTTFDSKEKARILAAEYAKREAWEIDGDELE